MYFVTPSAQDEPFLVKAPMCDVIIHRGSSKTNETLVTKAAPWARLQVRKLSPYTLFSQAENMRIWALSS